MPDITPPVEKPVEVNASALPETANTLLRYVLTAAGGVMVTKGYLPADSDVNTIVGIAMIGISTAWGLYRAKRNHAKLVTVAGNPRVPDSIARVT